MRVGRFCHVRARPSQVRERMTHEGWAVLSRPCAAKSSPRVGGEWLERALRRPQRGPIGGAFELEADELDPCRGGDAGLAVEEKRNLHGRSRERTVGVAQHIEAVEDRAGAI